MQKLLKFFHWELTLIVLFSIDVSLEWNGKTIEEQVFWFDNESDPSLNSNVFEMATAVVQKHFPGEFGSETLVRRVVDKILRETELKKNEEGNMVVWL